MSIAAKEHHRPAGITVSCLLLGWLAVAGFGNALIIPAAFAPGIRPEMLRAPPDLVAWTLAAAALLYGVAALVATISLWHMREWAANAFAAWAAVACGFMLLFLALIRLPPDTPMVLGLAFGGFVAAVFALWWKYIRSALARTGRPER